jgi:hypothetical protein
MLGWQLVRLLQLVCLLHNKDACELASSTPQSLRQTSRPWSFSPRLVVAMMTAAVDW